MVFRQKDDAIRMKLAAGRPSWAASSRHMKSMISMNKGIIAALVGGGAVMAALFWLNQPEPAPKTSQERLESAADTVAAALQEASEAISDGAAETAEKVKESVEESAAELAESVAQTADAAKTEANRLVAAWEDTGILTADGFSYESAIKAVNESALDEPTKAKIVSLLEQIQETPALFEEKMKEIRETLKS